MNYMNYVPESVRDFFSTFNTPTQITGDSKLRSICPIKYTGDYLYTASGLRHEKIDKSGLFIAAPPSHFNLTGLTEDTKNRGFFKVSITEPKDPIVFRYVVGGLQILSKWGKEAEDEAFINPINN